MEKPRVIWVNGFEANADSHFPSNYVSTTKYNVFTYLPLCLFEQFKRVANIYFLITAVLQSIEEISPLHPFSAIAPLVFVLFVSMLREGIEDYLRYRSDQKTNSAVTYIYQQGKFQEAEAKDIKVGNIVMVKKDQAFPCDLILLSSSDKNGIANIETASLDGEKNLKQRNSFEPTIGEFTDQNVIRFHSKLTCENPNPNLYIFSGKLWYQNKESSVDEKQLLLCAAKLRNTAYAIGIAVYTGIDTKLRQNLMDRRFKQSKVEKRVNYYILYIIIAQFFMCLIGAIGISVWASQNWSDNDYLGNQEDTSSLLGFKTYFTYFLLLNTMLPISLIVSLEVLKIVQAYFLQNDIGMFCKERNRRCKVSSSSLNEELGMIQHIFSDKTGTLTKNKMEFKFCSIGEKRYGDTRSLMDFSYERQVTYANREVQFSFDSQKLNQDLQIPEQLKEQITFKDTQSNFHSISTQSEIIDLFLKCMALCHDCLVDEDDNGKQSYSGSSPDEVALVDAAMHIGYRFIQGKGSYVEIEQSNTTQQFQILNRLEFNSTRQRSSSVIQDLANNTKYLFMKGADAKLMSMLSDQNLESFIKRINNDLQTYSERGLRTLVFAFRPLPEAEYQQWSELFDQASKEIENRKDKIDEVAEMIEKDMILLGCTAVEDKLQDDVGQTIQDLLNAGINVWMLTGDKMETAENIGRTCSLINDNMVIRKLPQDSLEKCLSTIIQIYDCFTQEFEKDRAIIIQGSVLDYILYDHNDYEKRKKFPNIANDLSYIQMASQMQQIFIKLAYISKTVICCRASPSQKQQVVKLIKCQGDIITLSIGDGANDVSMILEAHVGVGLYGEEGMQAVQASDYAIGEFKLLWELLLQHGRSYYIRLSEMILYFFYKNIVFTIPQFYFAFYCAFSGQTVYDDWYLTFYNMVFTALPLLVRALFDIDIIVSDRPNVVRDENQPPVVNDFTHITRSKHPYVYDIGRLNMIFTSKNFLIWMLNGFFHSGLVFFIPLYAASESNSLSEDGHNYDLWSISITSFTCVIIIVTIKLIIHTKIWNWVHFVVLGLFSIFPYFGFIFVYDFMTETPAYLTMGALASSYYFYINIIATSLLVLILDGGIYFARRVFRPTKSEILQDFIKNKGKTYCSSEPV